jgi:putative ABC transport system permease protein
LNLLRLITWPYVRKHLLRCFLTTAGIVLGVAVFVSMHTANRSVLGAFVQTVDRIAGKTQLQITAGETGFPEEVLERVQAVAEVRAAAPVIEAVADTGLPGEGNLLILAVDMTGDRSLREYDLEGEDEDVIEDPLVFLAQPDSLIVTREFAARHGLGLNQKIPLDTMEGEKRFTIRGLLRAGGLSSAFGGNLAVMDIYAAQKVFGRGRRFDRIDIGLREGVTLAAGQAALRRALGEGYEIEPPSGRGQQFESLLSIYAVSVNVSSLFALFIGIFIIYNSFSIAVTQRRGEIGILRALGATRAQVRTLFLIESAIAGIFGSAVGAALGLLASRKLAAETGAMMGQITGIGGPPEELVIDPRLLAAAMALGTLASMLAAWAPARSAARVDPVRALQKGKYQVLGEGENRLRRHAALAVALLSVICLLATQSRVFFYTGYLLMAAAAILMTPAIALRLAKLLRWPLRRLRPVEGALAADSLIQAPRRTSATVAALMLSLSMAIGLAGVSRASYRSLADWMESTLNPDLFVSTSENLTTRSFHFPAAMEGELLAMPGIDAAQAVRSVRVRYRGWPIMLVSVDLLSVAQRIPERRVVAGTYGVMHRLAAEGKGVIVSENLAELHRLRYGDPVELAAPGGIVRLPVVGIITDYSNQLGTVFMDRAHYIRMWRDDSIDIFRVYVEPGADPAEVRRRINERLGRHKRMFVLLNQEVKDYITRLTDQWFGMTYIQIGIAMLVAVLGIVNTLTVSIADRRRELGVLRAVGGLRRQIRATIWLEAAAIGLIGLILGVGLGAITLFYQLEMIRRDLSGMPFDYEFPAAMSVALLPVILGVAFASALVPAERAVRASLVEALEYE